MIAHLVRSADFERVLRTRSRVSSAHFAIHHVADRPSVPAKPQAKGAAIDLSTGGAAVDALPVDDIRIVVPGAVWLGTVVPKRHARRSVTRSQLKRQIRAAVMRHAEVLAGGLWVVRLRAPFDRSTFLSAASEALGRAARDELDGLMESAARRMTLDVVPRTRER